MGYSAAEFAAVLPAAMRDWQVSGESPRWVVHDAGGRRVALLTIKSLPERVIGALRLPVLHVSIDLRAADAEVCREFQRRFERGFHRGGG
jgi:hypothetical protein